MPGEEWVLPPPQVGHRYHLTIRRGVSSSWGKRGGVGCMSCILFLRSPISQVCRSWSLPGRGCLIPGTQLWSSPHLVQVTRYGQHLCPQGHFRTLTHNCFILLPGYSWVYDYKRLAGQYLILLVYKCRFKIIHLRCRQLTPTYQKYHYKRLQGLKNNIMTMKLGCAGLPLCLISPWLSW